MLKIIVYVLGIIVIIQAIALFNLTMSIDQLIGQLCIIPNDVSINYI